MAYFVTGATGFIGRYLVENLLRRGQPVYVLVRKGSEKKLAAMRKRWGADEKQVDRRRRRPRASPGSASARPTSRSSRARSTTSSISPRSTTSRRAPRRRRSPTSRARGTPCASPKRSGGLLPSRELDRGGGPLRRHVPRGHVRGGRRPRSSVFQDEARLPRASCAANASGRSASTGPGSSSAIRRPARSTRSTARTTSSRRCRSCATSLPPWMPMIGIEGGRINIVPVDFVADALDYLAHKKGLDGKCFHLTDPEPHRIGEVLNIFASAGHAPQMTMRINAKMFGFIPAPILYGLGSLAPVKRAIRVVLTDLGIPRDVFQFVNWPTRYDNREAAKALKGSGHRGAAARDLRAEAVGLLGAQSRPGPLHRPLARRPRQGQGGRRHRLVVGHRQGDGAEARRSGREGDPRRARRGEARSRRRRRSSARGGKALDLPGRHRRHRLVRRARAARATRSTAAATFSSTTPAARSAAA